jgi:hypothetical protein
MPMQKVTKTIRIGLWAISWRFCKKECVGEGGGSSKSVDVLTEGMRYTLTHHSPKVSLQYIKPATPLKWEVQIRRNPHLSLILSALKCIKGIRLGKQHKNIIKSSYCTISMVPTFVTSMHFFPLVACNSYISCNPKLLAKCFPEARPVLFGLDELGLP